MKSVAYAKHEHLLENLPCGKIEAVTIQFTKIYLHLFYWITLPNPHNRYVVGIIKKNREKCEAAKVLCKYCKW